MTTVRHVILNRYFKDCIESKVQMLQWPAGEYYKIQSFIYSPTDAPVSCLYSNIKFTLKHLRPVSVLQLHHHQGAH